MIKLAGLLALSMAWAHAAALAPAEQQEIVQKIVRELREKYVFPEAGNKMASALESKQREGGYKSVTAPEAFAKALTQDMQDSSHDRHLRVGYNDPAPSGAPPPRPASPVDDPKRLEGNIGYINIHGFPGPEQFSGPFERAMKELANADAIIVDLRANGGGSPQSVMFAAGFFIPKKTLVARIYSRPDDSTTEMWTTEVPGPHYSKELYILTSRRTFSAAEAMAYHMKALGRAIVVGEPSGGGAHRVQGVNLGKGFVMFVAFTRPTNVITGTDWEGTGVIPDIAVAVDHAIDAAQAAALKKLPPTKERTALITKLEGQIQQ